MPYTWQALMQLQHWLLSQGLCTKGTVTRNSFTGRQYWTYPPSTLIGKYWKVREVINLVTAYYIVAAHPQCWLSNVSWDYGIYMSDHLLKPSTCPHATELRSPLRVGTQQYCRVPEGRGLHQSPPDLYGQRQDTVPKPFSPHPFYTHGVTKI